MSTEPRTTPRLLIDQPEDGYVGTLGWVEAVCAEDEARDWLAKFCLGEDGEPGHRPVGPATREWLRPTTEPEYQRWDRAEPGDPGAVEFWKVVND